MSRRVVTGGFVVAVLIVVAVLLAGCGSSGRSNSMTSASATSTSSTRPSSSAVAASSSTRPTSISTSSSQTTQTSAGSSSAATTTHAQTNLTNSATHTQADTNAQLPAIFAIKAGGVLDPPQIAAPQRTAIELTIRSRDGRTHLFVLDTPHPYRATVHPGALTRRLLTGIPKGTYSIDVDHVKRGALIVGVAPGP